MPLSYDLTTFQILGQKSVKFLGGFLENLKFPKDILKLSDLYLSSAVFSFNTDQSFELIFYISLWSLSFFFLTHTQGQTAFCVSKNPKHVIGPRDRSQTTLTKVWLLHIYHLPPCVDIFYGINVDKMCTFLNHLLTLSCKRSL